MTEDSGGIYPIDPLPWSKGMAAGVRLGFIRSAVDGVWVVTWQATMES